MCNQKPNSKTSMRDYTNHTDYRGLPIAIEQGEKNVSNCCGLVFAQNKVKRQNVLRSLAKIIDSFVPRSHLALYSTEDLITQINSSLLIGKYELSDFNLLRKDKGFRSCVNKGIVASPSTLSRFYKKVAEYSQNFRDAICKKQNIDVKELSKTDPGRITNDLFMSLCDFTLNRSIQILKKYGPKKYGPRDLIIIDVDSTPVNVYGIKAEAEYDPHYRMNGYLPLLVFINGIPAIVQNAPGANYGAKLLMIHIDRIFSELRKEFPSATILLRGDTGFSFNPLIDVVEKYNGYYILGANHSLNKLNEALYIHLTDFVEDSLFDDVCVSDTLAQILRLDMFSIKHHSPEPRQELTRSTAEGKVRCCGFVPNYRAATWKKDRSIVYRLSFSPRFNDVNLRFIQTNLSIEDIIQISKGRGIAKNRARLEETLEKDPLNAEAAIELYESIFSDRGMEERLNREWKNDCGGANCSLNDFFSNYLHMILALVSMQEFEDLRRKHLSLQCNADSCRKARNKIKPNVTQSHCAVKITCGPEISTIRSNLIAITGRISELKRSTVYKIDDIGSDWQLTFNYLKT